MATSSATDRALIDLVRAGKVDAEIAVRLGMSKYVIEDRIAAICGERGFAGRAELAASRGDEPALPVVLPEETQRRALPMGSIVSLVAAMLVIGVAAWQFLPRPGQSSDVEPALSPAPAGAATSAPPAANNSMVNGVLVRDAAIGAPAFLPAGITLLILRTDENSGATSIERVTQTNEGLVNAVLLAPAPAEITKAVVSAEGTSIAAAVCSDCAPGTDGSMQVVRSDDSGATWQVLMTVTGPTFPGLVAVTRDDVVLDWGNGGVPNYRMADGGRICSGNGASLVASWWGRDGLATRSPASGEVVDCRGRTMFDPGLPADAVVESVRPFSKPGRVIAVSWREGTADAPEYLVAAFSSFENGALRIPMRASVTAWRGSSGFGTVFAADGRPHPVLYAFSKAMYHPLILAVSGQVEVIGASQ